MSKRRTYLHNAALLTGSGLVLRALGMGFRVVLAAYLGSEGMGLYQLILALYMVFVSFATAGVNVASARLAAQSLARGSGMAETLRGLCITALGFGTAAMLAQSVLAGPCARYLLHDVRAETALLILAPSLPFMAVSGAVRGCFLAARRVQPNITAQLIEQLVRMRPPPTRRRKSRGRNILSTKPPGFVENPGGCFVCMQGPGIPGPAV